MVFLPWIQYTILDVNDYEKLTGGSRAPPVRSRGHARVRDSGGMGIRNCIAFCKALSDGRLLDLNYSKFLLLGVERRGMLVIRG